MAIFVGKEKAWTALIAAWAQPVTTLAQWFVASQTGAFEAPDPDQIKLAVSLFVGGPFAAFGAWIATNSPTEESLTRHRAAALAAEMENVPLDPRVPMEPAPTQLKPREVPATVPA